MMPRKRKSSFTSKDEALVEPKKTLVERMSPDCCDKESQTPSATSNERKCSEDKIISVKLDSSKRNLSLSMYATSTNSNGIYDVGKSTTLPLSNDSIDVAVAKTNRSLDVAANEQVYHASPLAGLFGLVNTVSSGNSNQQPLKQQPEPRCELASESAGDLVQIQATPQSIINTIDQITKHTGEILDSLPKTALADMTIGENVVLGSTPPSSDIHDGNESFDDDIDLCDKLLESRDKSKDDVEANVIESVKIAMQPGSSPSSIMNTQNVESYLRLLGEEKLLNSIQSAFKSADTSGKGITSGTAQVKIADVCNKSNQRLPPGFASMFAFPKKRQKSLSENSELTRVRIAESLLLLGEQNKTKFCVGCKKPVQGDCIVHGDAMKSLKKTKAVSSLPDTMSIQASTMPNGGHGVFSLTIVEAGSLFGPLKGEVFHVDENKERAKNSFVWEVYSKDHVDVSHYVDCVDQEKSNWMRFVNCARFEEEQNLIAEQHDKKIYFKTYKKVLPGDEFLVWYGNTCGGVLQSLLKMDMDGENNQENNQETENPESETGKVTSKPGNEIASDLFQCSMCKTVFSSEHYLERHRTYVCPETSEFHCEECDTLFKSMENFRRHQQRGCALEKSFKCIICAAAFTQKANLKVHLKTHLNIRDFQCQYCERTFSRNTFLKNHVLSVHEKEKPFVCSECGKTFSRMDSMKRHAALHKERQTVCEQCGMMYHTINNLNMHIKRSHTDNTEMLEDKCRICSIVYPDIKSHMFFMHQKKAMEKCDVCNKYFRNVGNHMRSHNEPGKKKQDCPVCGKSFFSLNGHMKVHSKEKKKEIPDAVVKAGETKQSTTNTSTTDNKKTMKKETK